MKVVSVVNHKGGVGKTTTAFNLAYELIKRGKRTLLVDFDMQGNLTSAFGLDKGRIAGCCISDYIKQTMNGGVVEVNPFNAFIEDQNGPYEVNIIPCNLDMANTLLSLNSIMARELYLKMVLDAISESNQYDYCIIDCAPSIMVDFQNALVASDEILIVAHPDTFSTSGMESLLGEYKKVLKYFNPDIKVAGVLINNVDNRTVFTKSMVSLIKESWKDINVFETVIPSSIRVKESVLAHLPVGVYEPQNPASVAFSNFADEYLKENSDDKN